MNERQKNLVQSSFKLVAPYANIAAALFYKRLFKFDPAFRHLFKGDLPEQSQKFGNVLNEIVEDLDNLETLLPVIEDLGRRHAGYGVLAEHYDTVGAALIWTLRQTLGPDFTPPVEEAWLAAYNLLATVMQDAAANELALTAKTAAL